MAAKFKKSAKVHWMWLGNAIEGKVEGVFFEKIVKEIKGKKITRNGSEENPAYLVKSAAGNLALKLETELHKSEPKTKDKKSGPKKPTMF